MAQAKTQVLFQMDNTDYKKGYKEVERINKELSKSSQQLNRKLKSQEAQLKTMNEFAVDSRCLCLNILPRF